MHLEALHLSKLLNCIVAVYCISLDMYVCLLHTLQFVVQSIVCKLKFVLLKHVYKDILHKYCRYYV